MTAVQETRKAPLPRRLEPALRPPYLATAMVLLAIIGVSHFISLAHRHFTVVPGRDVPPLLAWWRPRVGWELLVPVALVASAALAIPRLLRVPRPAFLAVLVVFGFAFAVAVAAEWGGGAALRAPFRQPADYWNSVPLVLSHGPRSFARHYPEIFAGRRVHAATHPPGAVLLLYWLRKALGPSVLRVSLAVTLIGALGVLPTYALARALGGERAARAAALLFVGSSGVVIYSSTSMDVVFMTAAALALAALARAARSDAWAISSGLLAAVAVCFTFGNLVLVPIGAAVLLLAVRDETLPWAAAFRRGALALAGLVLGALMVRALVGIDLIATFRAAARAQAGIPIRTQRPYSYWAWANVAAFLISAGIPQTALFVAETRARFKERRLGLETLLWALLVALSVSGIFRGETDHNWLFLLPLLVAVAARSATAPRAAAVGGLTQAVTTQVLLYTGW